MHIKIWILCADTLYKQIGKERKRIFKNIALSFGGLGVLSNLNKLIVSELSDQHSAYIEHLRERFLICASV